MSESNNAHDNSVPPLAVSAEQAKNLAIDPLVLFQQVEQLRKDGVDEATIRAAFSDFMAQATGTQRRAQSTMKRHRDSLPMPTQEEINKAVEERYKGVLDESSDPHVKLILDAMENSKRVHEAILVKPSLGRRIALYLAQKMLGLTIFVFKVLGVK